MSEICSSLHSSYTACSGDVQIYCCLVYTWQSHQSEEWKAKRQTEKTEKGTQVSIFLCLLMLYIYIKIFKSIISSLTVMLIYSCWFSDFNSEAKGTYDSRSTEVWTMKVKTVFFHLRDLKSFWLLYANKTWHKEDFWIWLRSLSHLHQYMGQISSLH